MASKHLKTRDRVTAKEAAKADETNKRASVTSTPGAVYVWPKATRLEQYKPSSVS